MHITKMEEKKVNFTILVYQNSLMMHDGITDFRKLHVNSFNEARCTTLAIDLALHVVGKILLATFRLYSDNLLQASPRSIANVIYVIHGNMTLKKPGASNKHCTWNMFYSNLVPGERACV